MPTLNQLVRRIIRLRESSKAKITLLAVCPNSAAVLEAAVKVAAANNMPMLFAATLNQVDRDGGYTGWTPKQFVQQIRTLARKYRWDGPLYPCLDHGGPWLKDRHTLDRLSLEETMAEVRRSLTACLEAGYQLLHIDPTVDRTLPPGETIAIETVVERTLDLIEYAEKERQRLGLPPIAYEVGTEEVHGGLADFDNFKTFIRDLRTGLEARGLLHAWPCFIVGKVGTDLHTTDFDPEVAARLYDIVAPLGSLIKGHYTDWVSNPEAYPDSGMGGANVGPEFTAAEYLALSDLCAKETDLCRARPSLQPSRFMAVLEQAVLDSGRWQKWLTPEEEGKPFNELSPERRAWLVQTGSRYVWTQPAVVQAREALYQNISTVYPNPHDYVVDRIAQVMEKYVVAFHLFDSLTILG
ncbi:MAG TPA: class II D-tagatose-bisphosphate aldolase, non-catalytic subunit [Caldilineae bacterium]|nr:class II D-tagatose-bisphosphate aldolase, non-catalytic subunit [Caldilineae bacterium]